MRNFDFTEDLTSIRRLLETAEQRQKQGRPEGVLRNINSIKAIIDGLNIRLEDLLQGGENA
ncbi:TPA: hypothetical protein ACK3JW_001468 [Mannheimia haemolytica]